MKIKTLSDSVAEKIAAGEVVERPASVVKELVENALDAGAAEVRVELVAGGKALIAVQDDGCGMDPEDAAACFRRHATSKIASEEDLERIATLGFRGEALACISAVSRVALKTADGTSDRGTRIEREGDRLTGATEIAWPRGTRVEVRDLFFNVPARRKFLRSDRSELEQITRIVTHIALAHPQVRFSLEHGGRSIMDCPAVAGRRERIYQLYGGDLLERLMVVGHEDSACRIEGFASLPLTGRTGRAAQLFFVNRRPVKDRILLAAFKQAYRDILERDRVPEAFLFLELPPGEVDVNVHPAKSEVRFRDSHVVFRLILGGIERAAAGGSPLKNVWTGPDDPIIKARKRRPEIREEGRALGFGPDGPGGARTGAAGSGGAEARDLTSPDIAGAENAAGGAPGTGGTGPDIISPAEFRVRAEPSSGRPSEDSRTQGLDPSSPAEAKAGFHDSAPGQASRGIHGPVPDADRQPEAAGDEAGPCVIGQYLDAYIIAADGEGLLIVDQHNAHERILFERFGEVDRRRAWPRASPLFPALMELSPTQVLRLEDNAELLDGLGFRAEPMGGRTFALKEHPDVFGPAEAQDLFLSLLDGAGADKAENRRAKALATMACKAAVKAGEPLPREKMEFLVSELFRTSQPALCPHGRPVLLRLDRGRIERTLGRPES